MTDLPPGAFDVGPVPAAPRKRSSRSDTQRARPSTDRPSTPRASRESAREGATKPRRGRASKPPPVRPRPGCQPLNVDWVDPHDEAEPAPHPEAEPAEVSCRTDRLLVSKVEAAYRLSISLDTFERLVMPEVRVVRIGRRVLFPVAELERFVERRAAVPLAAEMRGLP